MDEPERERLLAGPLEADPEHASSIRTTLAPQLDEVRRRGYAQTIEELEEGLNAVAAPVRQADGAVVAALSVCRARRSGCAPVDLPRIGGR